MALVVVDDDDDEVAVVVVDVVVVVVEVRVEDEEIVTGFSPPLSSPSPPTHIMLDLELDLSASSIEPLLPLQILFLKSL